VGLPLKIILTDYMELRCDRVNFVKECNIILIILFSECLIFFNIELYTIHNLSTYIHVCSLAALHTSVNYVPLISSFL
jgi:hypothetical protein